MPTVWVSLRKSLDCKTEPSEVHEPKSRKQQLSTILTKKGSRSGCSRSIANLKDVIHGSRRHLERPSTCSPRSIGSNEFLNPITHEVILSNSKCELKITGFGSYHESHEGGVDVNYVGTLRPGTPGPGGQYNNPIPSRKAHSLVGSSSSLSKAVFGNGAFGVGVHQPHNVIPTAPVPQGPSPVVMCHKCGDLFTKWEALEAHHVSKHAVTELVEGDSSRRIVEIICRTSWLKTENSFGRIERVLKVHNMQKTLARFEEYREMVKNRASKLPKKHPRCLADGNELLRFYGTTIGCSLGMNGSSSLCVLEKCDVCRIIRHGFSAKKEMKGGVGVFTSSTSGRAFESVEIYEDADERCIRKALLVCRVIAGRVHKPLDNIQEVTSQSGFDSLAGKVGLHANIEELYLLNTRALLPCFVVICKP